MSRTTKKLPPKSAEAENRELVAMAYDETRRRLEDGTISSQLLTVLIKQGTVREELELQKLRNEAELIAARRQSLEEAKDLKELYEQAYGMYQLYTGEVDDDDEDVY